MTHPLRKSAKLSALRWLTRLVRAFPIALEKFHLTWARAELQRYHPTHPDLPEIVLRLRNLENAR